MIELSKVTFAYPGTSAPVLSELDFSVGRGEFVLICGPSGCGKTTLLRMLKPQLRPFGRLTGELTFEGRPFENLSEREQTAKIGFVQQSPENQIVTDKVWHELAFAMESLGYETETIRRKTAEMTEFFGIGSWFYKNVAELSGGQKQLLNLASVMTLDPEILVLDEPTSQLDPVAAGEFLSMLGKINRELGIAVVLSEHRLEEAIPLADRMTVLEKGKILFEGRPKEAGRKLTGDGASAAAFLTSPMRLWAKLQETQNGDDCPVSVREGKEWLRTYCRSHQPASSGNPASTDGKNKDEDRQKKTVLRAEELYFRYEKESPDVIRGLKLSLVQGEFAVLLGGNGTGKTTAMKLLAGLYEPQHGTVQCEKKRSMLPQDPKTIFSRKTVKEELEEAGSDPGRVREMLALLDLESLAARNPFDLSGGEQQRLAIGRLLLAKPEILLLDEPTKGLDGALKKQLASHLKAYIRDGGTVLMISHDVEFAAEYADRCMMFFDGNVVSENTPKKFFGGNRFYTTAVSRMTAGILTDAVTEKDVLEAFQKDAADCYEKETADSPAKEAAQIKASVAGKEPEDESGNSCEQNKEEAGSERQKTLAGVETGKKKRNVRKALAFLSGAAVIFFMGSIISKNRLSDYIKNGVLTDYALTNVSLYVGLAVSFVCLILAVGRKKDEKKENGCLPGTKNRPSARLSARTKASVLLLLLAAPATVVAGWLLFGGKQYYLISLLVLAECMIPFALVFEGRKPQARELALLAAMTAVAVAGRTAFFAVPGFTPIFGIVILAGIAFGAESGFLVGSLSMLLSNFLFGQGPWTPWQMFSMGLLGFLAGVIFKKGWFEQKRGAMAAVGAVMTVAVYGGIMNPASALMADRTGASTSILVYYFAGLPVDLVHGAATFVLLWFFGEEFLYRINRVKEKYGLMS